MLKDKQSERSVKQYCADLHETISFAILMATRAYHTTIFVNSDTGSATTESLRNPLTISPNRLTVRLARAARARVDEAERKERK